jgi:hypothetical protein
VRVYPPVLRESVALLELGDGSYCLRTDDPVNVDRRQPLQFALIVEQQLNRLDVIVAVNAAAPDARLDVDVQPGDDPQKRQCGNWRSNQRARRMRMVAIECDYDAWGVRGGPRGRKFGGGPAATNPS